MGFYFSALPRPFIDFLAADTATREVVAFELHLVALGAVDRANDHVRLGYDDTDHTVRELRQFASLVEVRADAYRAAGITAPAGGSVSALGDEDAQSSAAGP